MRVGTLYGAAATALAALSLAMPTLAQDSTTTTVTQTKRTGAGPAIHVTVNQKSVTFAGPGPVMAGGSVLVPLRGVFEQMGGQVQWEPATRVITGARPGHQFRIRVGSNRALVDGAQKTLGTPPRVMNGTTYVPLRFASEALGAQVAWQPDTRTVIITAGGNTTTTKKTTTTTTTTTTGQ